MHLSFPSGMRRARRGRSGRRLAISWNPGNLRFYYRGRGRERLQSLVVVLHGCGQSGEDYAHQTGWDDLAARDGFALLVVEQQAINNPDLCFNWFNPFHMQRHSGEPASIAAAVTELVHSGKVDPARVYITGLSAGGAMASAMLSIYPELFAAGAIIAGVPYGCANWVTAPGDCMSGSVRIPASELAGHVIRASSHKGPWPRVSVWHGREDTRVAPSNGDDIVRQWISIHGVRARPHIVDVVDGHPHRLWLSKDGTPVVEQYEIIGLGHAVPVDSSLGSPPSGQNVIATSISSTTRIAQFFGLDAGNGAGKNKVRAA